MTSEGLNPVWVEPGLGKALDLWHPAPGRARRLSPPEQVRGWGWRGLEWGEGFGVSDSGREEGLRIQEACVRAARRSRTAESAGSRRGAQR